MHGPGGPNPNRVGSLVEDGEAEDKPGALVGKRDRRRTREHGPRLAVASRARVRRSHDVVGLRAPAAPSEIRQPLAEELGFEVGAGVARVPQGGSAPVGRKHMANLDAVAGSAVDGDDLELAYLRNAALDRHDGALDRLVR